MPIQILVPTLGAQHCPSSMGFHVLLSGTHCAHGIAAARAVMTLIVMMQNHTNALVRPLVSRRSVIPNEVLVQPTAVSVKLARLLMMMMKRARSGTFRSQLWWPSPFSTTSTVVSPTVTAMVTWWRFVSLSALRDEKKGVTDPSAYQNPVVPPELAAGGALGVESQAEEHGGQTGQRPVGGQDERPSVIVWELRELFGCHPYGRHSERRGKPRERFSLGVARSARSSISRVVRPMRNKTQHRVAGSEVAVQVGLPST